MPIAIEALPRDKFNAWVLSQGGQLDHQKKPAAAAAAAPAAAAPAAAAPEASEAAATEAAATESAAPAA
jgi:cytochrome c oxidase subunit 2